MIWYGQYNAILIVTLVVGFLLAYIADNASIGVGVFMLVVLVRIFTGVINLLFKAFLGRPLVYDTKIMVRKDGGAAS